MPCSKGQSLHFYIILVGIIAGCGGLLFGYDIGISGGVISMPSFQQKFFPSIYDQAQAAAASGTENAYCTFGACARKNFPACPARPYPATHPSAHTPAPTRSQTTSCCSSSPPASTWRAWS